MRTSYVYIAARSRSLALAFALCTLAGCASKSAAPGAGEVWGQVRSVTGEALTDVQLSAGDAQTRSDPQGYFRLANVTASANVNVIAAHPDFGTGQIRVAVAADQRAVIDLALLPMQVIRLDDAAAGGVAAGSDGFSIALEPLSLVDELGEPAQGPVDVHYALIDDPSEMSAAPGAMLAEMDGEQTPLQSFGMVEVRFTQENRALTLSGGQATISFAAYGDHQHGDSIGLYHLESADGVWRPQGAGAVVGDAFQASVDHFSWWNADEPLAETACVRGVILKPNGQPAQGVLVHAIGLNYLTNVSALTDQRGAFEIRVPARSDNVLSAYWLEEVNGQTVSYRWSMPVYQTLAGACRDVGNVGLSERAATCVRGSVSGFDGARRATWWVHDEGGRESAFGIVDLVDGSAFCLDVPAGANLDIGGDLICGGSHLPLSNQSAACSAGQCQPLPLSCIASGPAANTCACGTRQANGTCVFAAEICDGLDNDCDGQIDEGLTTLITCGQGSCLAAGSTYCLAGRPISECQPRDRATPEDCNGRDDDCNGSVDEGLPTRSGPACGVGTCRVVSQESCSHGAWISPACQPLPATAPEICNALDDNCNGSVDESLARTVSCGVGVCNVEVSQSCSVGNWEGGVCPVPADFDACDARDNDCDGVTDEDQCCGGPPSDVTLTPRTSAPTIMVVQDISGSITPTWSQVRTAVVDAITPLDAQISFGLSLFPAPPGSLPAGTVLNVPATCAPGGIAVPPALHTGPAISTLLGGTFPYGSTPTSSTLAAIHNYLSGVPGQRYVVLITDGLPNCPADLVTGGAVSPSAQQAALLAADGIPVYTIGWAADPDLDMRELNQVAASGGTTQATRVSNGAELRTVLADLAQSTLICRFQLLEPVSAGQLVVSLNGSPLTPLLDPTNQSRGWVLLDEGQTIELRGSACDERKVGGVLHVENSCGVCGESPCDVLECNGAPARDIRTDVAAHLACPVVSHQVSSGSWAGTYRNTKVASDAVGNAYVLGELIGGQISGVDDSGLGQPCFVESFDTAGVSRFRTLLPARLCALAGIAVDASGEVAVAVTDLTATRALIHRLDARTGNITFSQQLSGFQRALGLVALPDAQGPGAHPLAVAAESAAPFVSSDGAMVPTGGVVLIEVLARSAGPVAYQTASLPSFRTVNDLAGGLAGGPQVYVAGVPNGVLNGNGRGVVQTVRFGAQPSTGFLHRYPAEVRAIAASSSTVFIAGDLDRSTSFGCTRLIHQGGRDIYATRIDPTTGDVLWARQLGGPDTERLGASSAGGGILVDSGGQFSLVGYYNGTAQLPGALYGTGAGSEGTFAVRLAASNGNALDVAELHGGVALDASSPGVSPAAMSLALGANGQLLTGFYGGALQISSYGPCGAP